MQGLTFSPDFGKGNTLQKNKYYDSFNDCQKDYPNYTIAYNLKDTDYIVLDIDDIEQHKELCSQFKLAKYKHYYEKYTFKDGDNHQTGAHIILRVPHSERYGTKHLNSLDILGNKEHTNVWIKSNKYPVNFNPELIPDNELQYFNVNLIRFIEMLVGKELYPQATTHNTGNSIDINSDSEDWVSFVGQIDIEELNNLIINNVKDLHHTEFWAIYTYCKYTNQDTYKFRSCWANSSSKSEQFSDIDSSIGLFINVLKEANINLNVNESSINKNWIGLKNPHGGFLDVSVLDEVFNNDSKYNLFVAPTGSGKTTTIVNYCLNNQRPFIIASPFIAVGVNYKHNFIEELNNIQNNKSLSNKFYEQYNDLYNNERVVFSENEEGKRVFKRYYSHIRKFEEIKELPTNYIMICTTQFLQTIGEGAYQYQDATLIIDEAHCINLDTKYCAENEVLFFEYFKKAIFVTATPNAQIIAMLHNYLPDMIKYKVEDIIPKININLIQPNERLINDEVIGNIILDILLSNRNSSAYCIYNNRKALDSIETICDNEGVRVCKIHSDMPLNNTKDLIGKSVIGTIAMSSSINLFDRDVCIINGVREMYNIIQSVNRNRSKGTVNVLVNSLMPMSSNYWFNYNINIVNKREFKDNKTLKSYVIDTVTNKEFSENIDKRTSLITREGKYYTFYKQARAVYFFRNYANLEGHIKEVKIGERIKFVDKDNIKGKREIVLIDECGKEVNDPFNLPYLFVNEFNKFNPKTKTHYIQSGENLKDICKYINQLIDYVDGKDLLQIWEDIDTYMSFNLGKRIGKNWNKPYSKQGYEKWKADQISKGFASKIKNPKRYIKEILSYQ